MTAAPRGDAISRETGLTVTIESSIPEDRIDMFHRLYEEVFGPLRSKAIARQVLRRSEFREEMADHLPYFDYPAGFGAVHGNSEDATVNGFNILRRFFALQSK